MRTLTVYSLSVIGISLIASSLHAGGKRRLESTETPIATIAVADIVDRLPSIDHELRLTTVPPQPVDNLVIETGRSYVSNSLPRVVPYNWSCNPKGKAWHCSGQEIPANQPAYFSWRSAPDVKIPSSFKIQLGYGGSYFYRDTVEPGYQHGFQVQSDLRNALNLPGGVAPGTRFMVSPASDDYRDGTWSFRAGGNTVPTIDTSALHWTPRFSTRAPRLDGLFYDLPKSAAPGVGYSFTYTNPWGDRTVDAQLPDYFYGSPCGQAGLHTCQERVAQGTSICLCGCFPNLLGADLTLDGMPIPFPTAMSSTQIRLPLQDVEPGTHVITWGALGQSKEFEVVSVAGNIGQNKLKVGEPTLLTFQLNGSKAKLPLKVTLNSKPEGTSAAAGKDVLILQGGNTQVAYFDGNAPNMILRGVVAKAIGDFTINYALHLPACPCGDWESDSSFDDSRIRHPMSAHASADALGPGGIYSTRIDFSSDSIVALAPKPPFDPTLPLQIDLAQLGLTGSTKYGDFHFEQRADMPSTAKVSNFSIGTNGGLLSGDAVFELHTDFTVPYSEDLPLRPGLNYGLDLQNFQLSGKSQGLGNIRLEQNPGQPSSIQFNNVEKDYSGKLLYGNADLRLNASISVKF